MEKQPACELINGATKPGFELVREEFVRNFSQRGEVGAACAVYYKGEKVVDLWGGYHDLKTRAPYLRQETFAALSSPATAPLKGTYDLVLHMQVAYALGFYKPCPAVRFGLNDRAFGSPGFGGSFGFADPELELGYAYAPNLLILGQGQDPRETALRKAVYKCVVTEKRE